MNIRELVKNNLRVSDIWKNAGQEEISDMAEPIMDTINIPLEVIIAHFEELGFESPCMDGIAF